MANRALLEIATRHQSHLERLKSSEVAKFDVFLKQMDADLRDRLTRGGTDLTVKKMEAQLKQIKKAMTGTLDDYAKVWHDSVKETSIYEAGFEQRSLENVVDGVSFQLPSDAQIVAAVYARPIMAAGGKLLDAVYKDFTTSESRKIQNIIRLGYAEGQTTQQILQRVRGTKAAKWRDGALAEVKRAQETMTRTALQHAANTARESVWQDNSDVIAGVKWCATLDSRTSATCRSLDGKEFPLNKGPRPPAHYSCRSTTVAVLPDNLKFLSKGRTRSDRDPVTGKVGTTTDKSYYSWLKGQPADVQDSILGPTRGKLLRDGGLSADRFAELNLGKNFEPLTLKEMRRIDATAFTKAGL